MIWERKRATGTGWLERGARNLANPPKTDRETTEHSMTTQTDHSRKRRTSPSEQACVVVVTYNHAEYIEDCLETVLANNPGEVVVVDSGSSDDTVAIVETEFPEVDIFRSEENLGYGAGNNRAVRRTDSEYVVVLNPDTRVGANCLEELLEPLSEDGRRITTPRLLTYDGQAVNTIGNVVHFSGVAFTRGFGDDPEAYSDPERLSGVSGACFATTRETYQEMGGFEESIFIYMDDVELSWKANAVGVDIQYVPSATVYHDYPGVCVDAEKLFHLERGRYIILRKYLGARGVALVCLSLLTTELLTWGYALLLGADGVRAKLRAVADAFSTSVTRVDVDERELLGLLDRRIPEDQLRSSAAVRMAISLANRLYETNAVLVSR